MAMQHPRPESQQSGSAPGTPMTTRLLIGAVMLAVVAAAVVAYGNGVFTSAPPPATHTQPTN